MKKLSVTLLALFVISAAVAAWYNTNTTLQTGNYQNVGWDKTLTIAANSDVKFTGSTSFSGGHLVIKTGATLTIQSQGLSANGTITLEPGASLIVNGNMSLNNAASRLTINQGSLTVSGNFAQSGPMEIGTDGSLTVGGEFTSSNGGINVLTNGRLTARTFVLNGNNSNAGFIEATQSVLINGGNLNFSGCGDFRTPSLDVRNGNIFTGMGFVVISQSYTNGRNSGWNGHPLAGSNTIGLNYGGPAINANWGNALIYPNSTNPCLQLLPVSFEKFKALPEVNNSFLLEWTAPETETTASYEIEVSEDNVSFRTIEIVPAKGEKGELRYQQRVHVGF